MPTLNPSAALPLLLLAVIVAAVGAHQAVRWRGAPREALHGWALAWCANALLVLASHYLQTVAGAAVAAELGARLGWTSWLFLIPVTVGLSHALAGRPLPRGLLAGVIGADLALVPLIWPPPSSRPRSISGWIA